MNAVRQAGFEGAMRQWLGHRPLQEDAAEFFPIPGDGLLALLADGMGGHLAGEIASREVIASFSQSFCAHPHDDIPLRFEKALNAANRHLRSIQKGAQIGNSGTTLVAVFLRRNKFWWLSVGDSMLLLWKEGERLIRLNEDHSMRPIAEEQWARGEISLPYALRQRSILRSAIMGDEISLIDISREPLTLDEDSFLFLVSDGLDEWVEEIRQVDFEHMKEASETSLDLLLDTIHCQVDGLDISYADNGTIAVIRRY